MTVAAIAVLSAAFALALPASASLSRPRGGYLIPLPGADSAEGNSAGSGSTFYVSDVFNGNIYRGNLRTRTAAVFIHAPTGREAAGEQVSLRDGLLFVAGGFTGQAYVYNIRTGATVAIYQLGDPSDTLINDCTLVRDGVWFNDSDNGRLFFVPLGHHGQLGPARTLWLTGPAAGPVYLNGITAAKGGRTLIVGGSNSGAMYTVDPRTGASAPIAGPAGNLPENDGIFLKGHSLWVVQNTDRVTVLRLSDDWSRSVVEKVITSPLFQGITQSVLIGNRLLVTNSKLPTVTPPFSEVALPVRHR